jgi:hypothetical protein
LSVSPPPPQAMSATVLAKAASQALILFMGYFST